MKIASTVPSPELSAVADKPSIVIQFPFPVQQLSENRIRISCQPGVSPISGDMLHRAFPWLSDEQLDELAGELAYKATESAIRAGITFCGH